MQRSGDHPHRTDKNCTSGVESCSGDTAGWGRLKRHGWSIDRWRRKSPVGGGTFLGLESVLEWTPLGLIGRMGMRRVGDVGVLRGGTSVETRRCSSRTAGVANLTCVTSLQSSALASPAFS